jgi:hypothetical protein
MEHPLIGDLNSLTVDELTTKISDLNQKLTFAMRTGNGHLCTQLRMAIESYNNKYQEKINEVYKTTQTNFKDKIDIS